MRYGVVYAREVDGQVLTFDVSGLLYDGILVMRDRETGSLWSQFISTAIDGHFDGMALEVVPAERISWKAWMEEHRTRSCWASLRNSMSESCI